MTRFIQLHLLTSYPPANLNRDDLGRPKTAVMGGALRLRISSQSLKRAWRTSDVFRNVLGEHTGIRTKEIGNKIEKDLIEKGVNEKDARKWAGLIAETFGKLKKDSAEVEQLVHFSPEEINRIDELVETIASRNKEPDQAELEQLPSEEHKASDIALFGRMLASKPKYNVEAAAQVAHAISVHKIAVEDDYFTAVDDLNDGQEDMGAGHLGETEFAAGLFYQYICINKDLLLTNLSEDKELADKTIKALIEAAATVSPTGKQNSFGSRARASYILCETGDQQPRSLAVAFLEPIYGKNMLELSIKKIEDAVEEMDRAYGDCANQRSQMNLHAQKGSLEDIINTAIAESE